MKPKNRAGAHLGCQATDFPALFLTLLKTAPFAPVWFEKKKGVSDALSRVWL